MRNVLLIIRREYLVRVRTKAFMFFTVLMPLLVGAVVVLPSQFMLRASSTRHIVIAAADRELADSVKNQLTVLRASGEDDPMQNDGGKKNQQDFEVSVETPLSEALRQQLIGEVRNGNLDGFAWIEPDAVATRKGIYYSRGTSDFMEASLVSRALRLALSGRQLADHGFSLSQAKTLLGPVHVDTVHIDRHGANKSNGLGAFFLPFVLLLAIYMTVLIYGLYVMRSVLEEKTSRVVEVLLSSVSPMQLMAGKIIGVGAVGLTQIGIWTAAGSVLGSGSFAVAHEIIGDSMKDAHLSTPVLCLFPVFFILGYATYACLYAAIGAMVNSDEEAQQFQFPVTLPLILCMVFATAIIRDPNTPFAFWLSMFPLTSPIIMFVRVSVSMPPVWQIVASMAISLVSLYGLVWISSRIYRIGILMYGKRPTLPEILRWIRYA
jgi:ABC-2 type transport system permease protein